MNNIMLILIGIMFLISIRLIPSQPEWANDLAFVLCLTAGIFCIAIGLDRAFG